MKHVIALDVSKGKSSVVIYDRYRQCEFEGELNHTRIDFERLHERIEEITKLDGQAPHIVKQLNAYAGIDIMRYQSGNTQYRDCINKRGNKHLRKILYFMIQGMLMLKEKPNHFVDYYYKLKTQPQRKPHKVAIIACVNKFLKVTFQLLTRGILYDYESALPDQKS